MTKDIIILVVVLPISLLITYFVNFKLQEQRLPIYTMATEGLSISNNTIEYKIKSGVIIVNSGALESFSEYEAVKRL